MALIRHNRRWIRWRHVYNRERPHQALDFKVPASRYTPSVRSFPKTLPQPDYAAGEIPARVGTTKAYISFKDRLCPCLRPSSARPSHSGRAQETDVTASVSAPPRSRPSTSMPSQMCKACLRTPVRDVSGLYNKGEDDGAWGNCSRQTSLFRICRQSRRRGSLPAPVFVRPGNGPAGTA